MNNEQFRLAKVVTEAISKSSYDIELINIDSYTVIDNSIKLVVCFKKDKKQKEDRQ